MSVQSLQEYRTRLAGLPDETFIGSVLWFSIAGTVEHTHDGRRVIQPVRVSQDQLERWFDELGLDQSHLPPRIKKVDAFRNASSSCRREYALDESETRFAELEVREVKTDTEQVIRQVVQIVRDERKIQLELHHMATLKFIRGGRTSKGKRHSGDHVKWAILSRVQGTDREQVQSLIEEFEERYDDQSANLQAPAIRGVIRSLLASMNAIAMKTSGGVYFTHKANWPSLDALQILVKRIGQGCVLEQFPLIDTSESRDMLTEAFQAEVEDDVRLLLKKIADLNMTARQRGGHITSKQYADLNHVYRDVAARAESHTQELNIAMGRAGAALEMALEAVLDMGSRIEFSR